MIKNYLFLEYLLITNYKTLRHMFVKKRNEHENGTAQKSIWMLMNERVPLTENIAAPVANIVSYNFMHERYDETSTNKSADVITKH